MLTKHTLDGVTLTLVVVGCSGTVGIDILDILWFQTGQLQGFLHSQIGALTFRRRSRLMEGVAGITIAAQHTLGFDATTFHRGLRL